VRLDTVSIDVLDETTDDLMETTMRGCLDLFEGKRCDGGIDRFVDLVSHARFVQ